MKPAIIESYYQSDSKNINYNLVRALKDHKIALKLNRIASLVALLRLYSSVAITIPFLGSQFFRQGIY